MSNTSTAQIVSGNGYLIGDAVEVAIHGNAGHEGTADWPGHHSRGGFAAVPYGFVANPNYDGWVDYDGDFFTPGVPENGFGIEINGTNYSNNAWNAITSTPFLQEIPEKPGTSITHSVDGECISVVWTGVVAGVEIRVKYNLVESYLFYTTEITLTNTTGSTINDLYYYRNVDPDNNEALTGSFNTTNTIEAQPGPDCIKALVSAEQATPWPSYVGIGALGDKFRVTHGGFSNRSASDIWNGSGGLNSTLGSTSTGDEAISIAYKTDLAPGASETFTFAVVLSEGAVEAAFSSLYYVDYETSIDFGGGVISECNPTTVIVNSCAGDTISLTINGPNTEEYDWTWFPGEVDGETVTITPTEEEGIVVIGTPISECLAGSITKYVSVNFTEGPDVVINEPIDPICGEYDVNLLEYYSLDSGLATNCVFLTQPPDSATQVEPAFDGPWMGYGDSVYVMCGDSTTGCFDYERIDINFIGPGMAGPDSLIELCGGPSLVINLNGIVPDTANQEGSFVELTESGRLDEETGIFNGSGIYGTFEFAYYLDEYPPCESDSAFYTIIIYEPPSVSFYYEVNGQSSLDGLHASCISNVIDFFSTASITPPQTITSYSWDFGDGTVSSEENPSHTYDSPGTYNISLRVESENGCTRVFGLPILIYETPDFDVIFDEPTCHGYDDGVIVVEPEIEIVPFMVDITDESGEIVNDDGSFTATGLETGIYYITLYDSSGCMNQDTVEIFQPDPLEIFYTIHHPPCAGDSGYVVIDSVAGENPNNPISYTWDPNPANIEGVDADSSYWMKAGDYSVLATDTRGCMAEADFTLVDPPPFYFVEWGWDTAYCRIYDYQSGNGFVYAAVAGGLLNYTYEWTYLVDGSTSNTSTWGGRNPGDHLIKVTDAGGCVLTKTIYVDSVNPIASFTINSLDLNDNLEGTAPVYAEYTNTSQYYATPNNPDADTLFLWDLDRTEIDDWLISHNINDQYDTTYEARGESYNVDVCLIAFNKNGCRDTACKTITIWEPPVLDVVNVFTPDGDGTNDTFTFKHHQKGIDEFHCIIVNRWGVQVAEINDILSGWDGKLANGDYCSDGVYFYSYTATADNGEKFSGQGNVTLLNSRK